MFTPGFPEDGFSVAAWNGRDGPYSLAFFASVGGTGQEWRAFPNSVDIPLPRRSPDNADLLNFAVMRKAFLSVISAWEPDCGNLCPWGYEKRWADDTGWYPNFCSGWMSYVSGQYAGLITPPHAGIVEQVPGGGLLMAATKEPFAIGNAAHEAGADAIQAALAPIQDLVRPPREFKRPKL